MTTLVPTPTINPNVPVVTSAGGTTAAYQDPNSPESILRQTAELKQQAITDSMYDVNVSAYEKKPKSQGFVNYQSPQTQRTILLTFLTLIITILLTQKRLTANARLFLSTLAVILLLLVIFYFTK